MDHIINDDCEKVFVVTGSESVDLILTDPPYKNYRSNRVSRERQVRRVKAADFDLPMFAYESRRVSKPGGHLYCFCDHNTLPTIRAGLEAAGWWYKNTLVWVKNNHGSGDLVGDFAPRHEFILFMTKGKGHPLSRPRRDNVLFANKVRAGRHKHGTEKPVHLLRTLITASTQPGEIVFDPYAGTGATAEAAYLENRGYVLVETIAEYCESARRRLASLVF